MVWLRDQPTATVAGCELRVLSHRSTAKPVSVITDK
jgi:hypothetical protein